MSSISILYGIPSNVPIFYRVEETEDIATGSYCIPIGWLAMFTPADVICVADRDDASSTCPTLITSKDRALSNLRRRIEFHAGELDPTFIGYFTQLEELVRNCKSEYIQVGLTDLDIFVSYPESIETLSEWVSAMDTSDAVQWSGPLELAQARVDGDLNHIRFFDDDFIASGIMGYV